MLRIFGNRARYGCLFVGVLMLACVPNSPQVNAAPGEHVQLGSPAFATISSTPRATQVTSGTLLPVAEPIVELAASDEAGDTSPTVASSDSFVDSIGFNAHFENYHTSYVTQFEKVKSLLLASGVRHVRVGMWFGREAFYAIMKDLAASGIYASYTTSLKFSQDQIQAFPGLVGASFEQYEAPNEQDDQSNLDWVEPCRAYQKNLYAWVKENPQTARYPVLGPSLARGEKEFTALGDLSDYMDYANIHDYFSVFHPGTPGWGRRSQYGVYGSVRRSLNLVRLTSANKPVMSTESGFGGTPTGNETTDDFRTQMRYLSRLFFEHFNDGIVRTYSYEFIDKGGAGPYSDFGVLQTDLTPKPAYTAIKSLIAALKDPGPAFKLTPLTFTLTGATTSVHHTLLEKRNGQYIVAVWLEVPSWKPHGGGDIVVPEQSVTLSTTKSVSSAKIATMDEGGKLSSRSLRWEHGAATFAVSDKVSLITLSP